MELYQRGSAVGQGTLAGTLHVTQYLGSRDICLIRRDVSYPRCVRHRCRRLGHQNQGGNAVNCLLQ
jgi:hypothetical protein